MDQTFVKMFGPSIVRHVLTIAAGSLGSLGVLQANQETQFVQMGSSIVLGLAALVWSWYEKQGHAELVRQLKVLNKGA